jgi:branched-chain amino acid transport system substrate-binding protein
MLNERDGGINGVKVAWEECETQYDTKQGVECYERLKGKGGGALIVNPYSTGITYQLIPKAPVDKLVVFSMGYGMSAASDGRWFPWVFNFPTNYWSQASAVIRYIGSQEGGLDKLKGKKIAHIFHNSPYGKEANPTLEDLARKHGFELTQLAVDHPGQEQKSTWLQVRRLNPDWIFMSGWGVMNQVAVKEAAATGFKMDHFIGNWWSANDSDVVAAGDGAKGYKGATFHAPGTNFKVHAEVVKFVYDKGKNVGKKEEMGAPLYNRGLVNAMLSAEAIRTAMGKFGNKPLTGEQVRWGFENLNLTEARLDQLGMKGFTHPVKVTCEDHEGSGPILVQQWDGKKWNIVSDWVTPMRDVVRPKIEAAAVDEAKKLGYTMRDCSKEK